MMKAFRTFTGWMTYCQSLSLLLPELGSWAQIQCQNPDSVVLVGTSPLAEVVLKTIHPPSSSHSLMFVLCWPISSSRVYGRSRKGKKAREKVLNNKWMLLSDYKPDRCTWPPTLLDSIHVYVYVYVVQHGTVVLIWKQTSSEDGNGHAWALYKSMTPSVVQLYNTVAQEVTVPWLLSYRGKTQFASMTPNSNQATSPTAALCCCATHAR